MVWFVYVSAQGGPRAHAQITKVGQEVVSACGRTLTPSGSRRYEGEARGAGRALSIPVCHRCAQAERRRLVAAARGLLTRSVNAQTPKGNHAQNV